MNSIQEHSVNNQEPFLNEGFIIEGKDMGNGMPVEIKPMSLNKIKLSKNSRRAISDDEIAGLMASIKSVGLLQPIGVTQSGSGGYEICYGNRRFIACSKLGIKKIPVIIHKNNTETEIDLKNLSENLQRRNITISEAGRYMELLESQGLGQREIAVRLGISKSYVGACLEAYHQVPAKHRKDLEMKSRSGSTTPGKLSISTALKIADATRRSKLSEDQSEALYMAAKAQKKGFSQENISKYATAIKSGDKNFLKTVDKLIHVSVNFFMTEFEFERMKTKYVNDGPFSSAGQLCKAILKGEKSQQIKIAKG
jgi:ParB family chromosome partitioning protein